MTDLLQRLQGWYAANCNGEWEHHRGVRIETCDNPGWWVKIDIEGTPLDSRPIATISENGDAAGLRQGDRWLCCRVEDGIWHGAGDETKLGVIFETFLAWASAGTT